MFSRGPALLPSRQGRAHGKLFLIPHGKHRESLPNLVTELAALDRVKQSLYAARRYGATESALIEDYTHLTNDLFRLAMNLFKHLDPQDDQPVTPAERLAVADGWGDDGSMGDQDCDDCCTCGPMIETTAISEFERTYTLAEIGKILDLFGRV